MEPGRERFEGRLDIGSGYHVRYLKRLTFPAGPLPGFREGTTFPVVDAGDAVLTAGSLDYETTIEVEGEAGRLTCTGISVKQAPGGPPVSAEGLARVPVVRLFRVLGLLDRDTAPSSGTPLPPVYRGDEVVSIGELPTLEQVAVVYRVALAFGEAPTKAVAAYLEVSSAVAAKRVQAARRASLLDPTTAGKKGR